MLFVYNTKPKAPEEFGYFQHNPKQYSYQDWSKSLSEVEYNLLRDGSKLSDFVSDDIRPCLLSISLNNERKELECVYEQSVGDSPKKNFTCLSPKSHITPAKPKHWSKKSYFPNAEFSLFLDISLQEGFILEKIIGNRLLFSELQSHINPPRYKIVDRSPENYLPFSPKIVPSLQQLIDVESQLGYRFVGGFRGAKIAESAEYSAWIFIEDPMAPSVPSVVIPVPEKFAVPSFLSEEKVLEVLRTWAEDGWELLSVLYSKKTKQKGSIVVNRYSPYLVMHQGNPEKVTKNHKKSEIPPVVIFPEKKRKKKSPVRGSPKQTEGDEGTETPKIGSSMTTPSPRKTSGRSRKKPSQPEDSRSSKLSPPNIMPSPPTSTNQKSHPTTHTSPYEQPSLEKSLKSGKTQKQHRLTKSSETTSLVREELPKRNLDYKELGENLTQLDD